MIWHIKCHAILHELSPLSSPFPSPSPLTPCVCSPPPLPFPFLHQLIASHFIFKDGSVLRERSGGGLLWCQEVDPKFTHSTSYRVSSSLSSPRLEHERPLKMERFSPWRRSYIQGFFFNFCSFNGWLNNMLQIQKPKWWFIQQIFGHEWRMRVAPL